MGQYCTECGDKDCTKHTNGSKIRQEIEHQGQMGEFVHQALENKINEIKKDISHRSEKNERSIRYSLTLTVSLIVLIGGFTFWDEGNLATKIEGVQADLYKIREQLAELQALEDAILTGKVQPGYLDERLADIQQQITDIRIQIRALQ